MHCMHACTNMYIIILYIICRQQYSLCVGNAATLTDYLALRDALCAVTFALSLVALLLVIAAVVLVHVIKKSES